MKRRRSLKGPKLLRYAEGGPVSRNQVERVQRSHGFSEHSTPLTPLKKAIDGSIPPKREDQEKRPPPPPQGGVRG